MSDIIGNAWLEIAADGIFDPNIFQEGPLSGVTVELLNSNGTSTGLTTTTDASGQYSFTGLNPGAYRVRFSADLISENLGLTLADQGSDETLDSDPDRVTGITAIVSLGANQTRDDVDAGFIYTDIGPFIFGLENPAIFEASDFSSGPQLLDPDVTFDEHLEFTNDDGEFEVPLDTLLISALLPEDSLSLANVGTGPGQISLAPGGSGETIISLAGTRVGIIDASSNGVSGSDLLIDFDSGAGTQATVETVLENLTYVNSAVTPTESRTLTFLLTAEDGATGSLSSEIIVNAASNSPPVAVDDYFEVNEDEILTGVNLFNANSEDPLNPPNPVADFDPDGDSFTVNKISFLPEGLAIGLPLTLGGMRWTIAANGDLTLDQLGFFENLNDGDFGTATITYQITDGVPGSQSNTGTITVRVNGVTDVPDVAPVVSITSDVNVTEGDPGIDGATQTVTLTLFLEEAASEDVEVFLQTRDGTATDNETGGFGGVFNDYVTFNSSVIIPAGSTQQTFDITVNNDILVEGLEDFFVDITGATRPSGGAVTVDSTAETAQIIIENDDVTQLVITTNSPQVERNAFDTFEVNFTLTKPVDVTVEADVMTALDASGANPATISFDGDLFQTNFGLLFLPESTTEVVNPRTIGTFSDLFIEDPETFLLVNTSLGISPGEGITGREDQFILADDEVLTILDGTIPGVPAASISLPNGNEFGEGSDVVFQVNLSEPANGDVEILIEASFINFTGFATADDFDLSAAGFPTTSPFQIFVTVLDGETSAQFTLPALADGVAEGSEDFFVDVLPSPTDAYNVDPEASFVTATIVDDEIFLSIAPDDADKAEGNTGNSPFTPFTFTVTRSGDLSGTTTVDYAVSPGATDPVDGADFGGMGPIGTVEFAPNESEKTITVDVFGDTDEETDETFIVTLSNPNPASAQIVTNTATGIIRNDDEAAVPPTISIAPDDTEKAEGNNGLTAFTFLVTRSGDTSGESSVDFAVSPSGTNPVSGADFDGGMGPSGTLFFAADETEKTITVNVQGDTVVEADETFTVTLSAPSNATVEPATATGTILNDDITEVTLDDQTVVEGGSYFHTIRLTNPVDVDVVVNGETLDTGSATVGVGGDIINSFFSTLIAAGETEVTIPFPLATFEDTEVEGTETFEIMITGLEFLDTQVGRAGQLTIGPNATYTILDNDTAIEADPAVELIKTVETDIQSLSLDTPSPTIYTYTIRNISDDNDGDPDALTVTSLMDDQFGDILADAVAANGGNPIVIPEGGEFSFELTRNLIRTDAVPQEATVEAEDEEGTIASDVFMPSGTLGVQTVTEEVSETDVEDIAITRDVGQVLLLPNGCEVILYLKADGTTSIEANILGTDYSDMVSALLGDLDPGDPLPTGATPPPLPVSFTTPTTPGITEIGTATERLDRGETVETETTYAVTLTPDAQFIGDINDPLNITVIQGTVNVTTTITTTTTQHFTDVSVTDRVITEVSSVTDAIALLGSEPVEIIDALEAKLEPDGQDPAIELVKCIDGLLADISDTVPQPVTFQYSIRNISDPNDGDPDTLTVISLLDDQFGDLLSEAEAANGGNPIVIPEGGEFTFEITRTLTQSEALPQSATVTAEDEETVLATDRFNDGDGILLIEKTTIQETVEDVTTLDPVMRTVAQVLNLPGNCQVILLLNEDGSTSIVANIQGSDFSGDVSGLLGNLMGADFAGAPIPGIQVDPGTLPDTAGETVLNSGTARRDDGETSESSDPSVNLTEEPGTIFTGDVDDYKNIDVIIGQVDITIITVETTTQHFTDIPYSDKVLVEDVSVEAAIDLLDDDPALANIVAALEDKLEPDNVPPTAIIDASDTDIDEGGQVSFDGTDSFDTDGTIASYAWDLDGDGTVDSTDPTPSFTYSDAGTYTATLTVTDDDGATGTTTQTITVTEPSGGGGGEPITLCADQSHAGVAGPVAFGVGVKIQGFDLQGNSEKLGFGDGGLGVNGAQFGLPGENVFSNQIDHRGGESERIQIDFASEVSDVKLVLGRQFAGEAGKGELAHYAAYDENGDLISEGVLDTDQGEMLGANMWAYNIGLSGIARLDLTAPDLYEGGPQGNLQSDFNLQKLTYTPSSQSSGGGDGGGGDGGAMSGDVAIGLYDAQTDTLITQIQEGTQISSTLINDIKLSFAAFVANDSIFAGSVESARISLNNGEYSRVENVEPYALFGDNSGDFFGREDILHPGQNSLSLELYSQKGAQGDNLGDISINFDVFDVV